MKRILLFFLLLFTSWVNAQNNGQDNDKCKLPVDNGYPYFLTTSVFPMDKGLLEWDLEPVYSHGGSGTTVLGPRKKHKRRTEGKDTDRELLFLPQISYGITDSLQVGLGFIPYMIHWETQDPSLRGWEHNQGYGDTFLSMQYSWIYIAKTTCCAAVAFNVSFPTGSIEKDLTDGFIHYTPTFILTKDLIHNNWRTQFFTQAAISFVQREKHHTDRSKDATSAHDFIFNFGIAERSEKINYSLEFNWITDTWNHEGDSNEFYVTPGVFAYVRKDVAIGLGVPIGLTRDSDKFQVILNLLIDIETIFSKKDSDNDDQKSNSKSKSSLKNKHERERQRERESNIPLSSPHRIHGR